MYPILVFDENLNYLTQIDDYEYLRWNRRWRKQHAWEIQINRYKKNVQHLLPGYFIAVQRGGQWRSGRIELKEIGLDENGKISENWKVQGFSYGLFNHRLALHNTSSGTGYDAQSDVAERVMRHYVNVNVINPVDLDRIVPFLELNADLGRGIIVKTRARFQTLSQVLEDISLASGVGWETTIDLNNKKFVFNILEGRDLTPSQGVNPPVIFSPEFDNVKMLGYRYSTLDSKNLAYVGGQGSAATRTIVQVGNASGINRREFFIDARDLETTEQLTQRGNEKLAELGEELVMEVENLPNGPFKYLIDFDLGDIVHVNYPDIGSMDSRIIEVVEEITPELGETHKLIVGREWPDLINVIRNDRRNYETEVRR
jgi:hypothetical protein